MRITSIGAPGVPNPAGASNNNVTRVAISESGNNPITKPRSLLHLGYNTGLNSFPQGSTDGWRNWMDIGTFMSNGTDNMYVGLKTESGAFPSQDRQDAVINWGDNGGSNPFNGPDNLRFIFTSTTSSFVPPYPGSPAPDPNGLEVARMVPSIASTLSAPNYGMMGVGDFSPTGPNTALNDVVDAKLDIDGDLRIRTVTEDSTLKQVLVIDSTDHNRVHWIDANELVGGGNITANNGATINPLHNVQWGQVNSGNGTNNGGELVQETEIPFNNQNIYFSDPIGVYSNNENRIQVGGNSTTFPNNIFLQSSKFSSLTIENNTFPVKVAGYFATNAKNPYYYSIPLKFSPFYFGNQTPVSRIGVVGIANDSLNPSFMHIGVTGGAYSSTSQDNVGVSGKSYGSPMHNSGGTFMGGSATSTAINIGVSGSAIGQGVENYGVRGFAQSLDPGSTNYAIYGKATTTGGVNYAGYFDGDVYVNGGTNSGTGYLIASDAQFKNEIDTVTNPLGIVNSLQPKTFFYDTTNIYDIHFSEKRQYGFVAQDIEPILPELVYEVTKPAEYDSLGNVVINAITYKELNYNAFIAILMSGMQQQQDSIEMMADQLEDQRAINAAQDSTIGSLNDRLSHLEECLSGILPILCRINQSAIQQTPEETRSQLVQEIQVTLSDAANIVLNQNVPNPFAERTVISYSIPETVGEAQIVFYNAQGKQIKSVDIQERGEGRINVYANDLSTGIYTYSLVVDGKIAATKKMMKQ